MQHLLFLCAARQKCHNRKTRFGCGYCDGRCLMISEMPVKLKEIFQELDAVPADNYQNRSEIRNKFYAVLSGNSSLIEAIYDAYFQCLRVILINDYEFRDIDQILAYKFITLFSSPSTSMPGDVRAGFFRVLSERHREHKELLEVALSSIDRCISPIHGHRKTGNLSDIPTAMLEAYCWHRPLFCGSAGNRR